MRKPAPRFSQIIFWLLLVMLLPGCAGTSVPYQQYTLKPLADAQSCTSQFSLGVQPVILPPWLDQNRISWNDGDVNQTIMERDRWVGPLSTLIDQTMLRNFSRIYPDTAVSLGPWVRSATPDRVLSVQMMSLERVNNELAAETIIRISDQQRTVLFNSYRTYRQPLADNSSAREFTKALGTLLGNMSQEIALEISTCYPGKQQ